MRPTFRIRAGRSWPRRTAAVAAAASLGCAAVAAAAASAPGYAGAATARAATTAAAAGRLMVAPKSFSVAQGTREVFGVSLSSAPSANVTVSVSRSSGNSGLTVGSGASLTFTPSNWNYPQPVTVMANASGTGTAAFTATAPGYAATSVTGNETLHGATGIIGWPIPFHATPRIFVYVTADNTLVGCIFVLRDIIMVGFHLFTTLSIKFPLHVYQ